MKTSSELDETWSTSTYGTYGHDPIENFAI